MKVSNCCGATPAQIEDMDSTDFGICPKCNEHCEFEDLSDNQATKDTTAAIDLFAKMGEIFAPVSLITIKKSK